MIRSEKMSNALYAIHTVLVLARGMAYEGRSGTEIAEVLDTAEYLPRLLAVSDDQTEQFRRFLVDLAGKHTSLQLAVDRFDKTAPLSW